MLIGTLENEALIIIINECEIIYNMCRINVCPTFTKYDFQASQIIFDTKEQTKLITE